MSASSDVTPSGFSVIRTIVPPPRAIISILTFAVPSGRPFARRHSRRGPSASSATVWSLISKGPKPMVWWNLEPGAGHCGSASRISFDPTTQ